MSSFDETRHPDDETRRPPLHEEDFRRPSGRPPLPSMERPGDSAEEPVLEEEEVAQTGPAHPSIGEKLAHSWPLIAAAVLAAILVSVSYATGRSAKTDAAGAQDTATTVSEDLKRFKDENFKADHERLGKLEKSFDSFAKEVSDYSKANNIRVTALEGAQKDLGTGLLNLGKRTSEVETEAKMARQTADNAVAMAETAQVIAKEAKADAAAAQKTADNAVARVWALETESQTTKERLAGLEAKQKSFEAIVKQAKEAAKKANARLDAGSLLTPAQKKYLSDLVIQCREIREKTPMLAREKAAAEQRLAGLEAEVRQARAAADAAAARVPTVVVEPVPVRCWRRVR